MRQLKQLCLAMPCIVLSACDEYYMPDLGQALQWSDPKTIREVLVSTSNQRLLAFRTDPEQAFEIVIARSGRKDLEHCTAGPGFARFLEAASSIFMVKKVESVVETDTEDWVTVETWDASTNPGTELRLRAPNERDPRTIMQWWLYDQYVVELDDGFWTDIASGCSRLGVQGQQTEKAP